MQPYTIGIDTGGTFTDAVLLDNGSGVVLASIKTPTTHYRLSLGIATALGEILRQHFPESGGVGNAVGAARIGLAASRMATS